MANNEYFDFVLCKFTGSDKRYLFHAPAFSHLIKGDEVVVETVNGAQRAEVVSSMTLSQTDRAEIDFVMNATRAGDDIKKVLGVMSFKKLDWEDEKDE